MLWRVEPLPSARAAERRRGPALQDADRSSSSSSRTLEEETTTRDVHSSLCTPHHASACLSQLLVHSPRDAASCVGVSQQRAAALPHPAPLDLRRVGTEAGR